MMDHRLVWRSIFIPSHCSANILPPVCLLILCFQSFRVHHRATDTCKKNNHAHMPKHKTDKTKYVIFCTSLWYTQKEPTQVQGEHANWGLYVERPQARMWTFLMHQCYQPDSSDFSNKFAWDCKSVRRSFVSTSLLWLSATCNQSILGLFSTESIWQHFSSTYLMRDK